MSKNNIIAKLLLASAIAFTTPALQAQEILSLKKCIETGLENNYSIRISRNEQKVAENNMTPGNAGTSSATANKGLYSSVENIVVGEDGTLTLTIQGNGSSSYGRTALNYLALTQVPEPATAALSLLGAAALFLRRRRD